MDKKTIDELCTALDAICDTERLTGCSDLYYRQVMTQKIAALKAWDYHDKLSNSLNTNSTHNKEGNEK